MDRFTAAEMSGRIWRIYSGIRGLPNVCACCCVNTLLQTLSATDELVESLGRWDVSHLRPGEGRNVPFELKKFFVAGSNSHGAFLECLHRNGVQLHTQHDADEVFLVILNLIKNQMDDSNLAEEIQNLYKISLESHVQCLRCDSVQSKQSYMLSLPLHVEEAHTSLEQSLALFFEEHELTGINCCFCVQCTDKTPSKQGVRLLSLPPIMCIQLKRYRNNAGFIQKLDNVVTFPDTFDMSTAVPQAFSNNFSQTDCRYNLYAVVVHSGSARCGHYTAYVRPKDSQSWFYADDSNTHQVSWEKVRSSYGGKNRQTAYMLMYRRAGEGKTQGLK